MSRVLVVEDSRTQALQIQLLLEDAGYHVATAANGKEGLDRLEFARPSLILLDLMMPVMSGPEFLQVLIEDKNHAPVVVVSAYGEIADPATGISDFIPKPVRLDRLLDAVSRYC